MTNKLLFPALAGALLLSGCGPQTPLPTFGKPLVAQWIQADFDGQPGNEYIATSNLQDIVFNARGEIIGWYVKPNAGTPYIKERGDGTYDFSALQEQRGVVNMVGQTGVQGVPNNYPPERRAFVLKGDALDPAQPAETVTPVLNTDIANNTQTAVFKYTQNGVAVTKTFTLHPRNFRINFKNDVQGGAERVNLLLPGLGKADNPRVQAYPTGGTQPVSVTGSGTATVQNAQYAALQENPSQVAHALIVRPVGTTTLNATLTGGQQGLITAEIPAKNELEVYGGKNELIHLYQSGYTMLPGLFKPNFFGDISLWIVKLMEFLYKFIGDWGLVIIALTIILRLVMWPMMQAQGRSTAKMQAMQPKIQEIQARYKDKKDIESQRAMQMETAQLYKEHNMNPAGCLSGFLPFPVLIALWSTIRNFEFDKGFLWLPDLAIPDPFYILALLYLVVNVGNLFVMTRKQPEMFRQQVFMYIFFLYFAFTFPAGVIIYSILSTLIGIIQQVMINKQVEKETASLGVTVEKVSETTLTTKKTKTIDAPKD